MHQRAVVCTMCGGKFFPASLAFHQKACAAKQASVMLPCPYCDEEVPKLQLDKHIKSSCKKSPKPAKKAAAGSVPSGGEDAFRSINDVIDDQGRMQCAVCGRWFLQDRIGKHQNICRAVTRRNEAKPRTTFDSFKQRQFDPLIRPAMEKNCIGSGDPALIPAARSYYSAASPAERALQNVSSSRFMPTRDRPSISLTSKETGRQRPPSSRESVTVTAKQSSPGVHTRASVCSRPPTFASPSRGSQASSVPSRKGTPTTNESVRSAIPRSNRLGSSRQAAEQAKALVGGDKDRVGSRRSSGASIAPAQAANRQNLRIPTAGAGRSPRGSVGGRRDKPSSPTQARSRPSPAFLSPGRCTPPGESGGGKILQTNESSLDNPLAYPCYPADGGNLALHQTARSLSPGIATDYQSPVSSRDPRVQGITYPSSGGGGLLPTNETSADNPLAYPHWRG